MKTKTVIKTTMFPADKSEVYRLLTKLETLQYIAWPYASFTPVSGSESLVWEEGSTSHFYFKLMSFIPFGTHTIHVIRFDEKGGIYTREGNEHVPVWNHEIILKELSGNRCEYTDRVEIGAGWKTIFVWIWANAFYRHRQRKWIHMLKKKSRRQ